MAMGELPDIIEVALNHVAIRSPLGCDIQPLPYRPQVATALQRLADALDASRREPAPWCPYGASETDRFACRVRHHPQG